MFDVRTAFLFDEDHGGRAEICGGARRLRTGSSSKGNGRKIPRVPRKGCGALRENKMKTKTEKNQTNHPKAVSREESLAERLQLLAIATTAGPEPAADARSTVYNDRRGTSHHVQPW